MSETASCRRRRLKFLRTATIQGLRVRATRADVRAALGPPADTSAIKSLIWKYDDTEITFHKGDVVLIAVSFAAEAEAARRRLDDEELPYEPLAALTHDAQSAFVIPNSGVTLTLDHEQDLARAFAT